jgi:hypothetical protein
MEGNRNGWTVTENSTVPRTKRPSIRLNIPGDPFTLFYDYDQVEDRKLTGFTEKQKAIWLERRLGMAFIEPCRRIWKERTVFETLLEWKLDSQKECCFSIAAMGIMLNVVEALGSFRNPQLANAEDRDSNWKMFLEFLSNHMKEWSVNTASNVFVPKVLWRSFRNGIAHDLRVGQASEDGMLWGSLEFRGNFADPSKKRFEKHGQLLRVCPEDFFDDMKSGVDDYFAKLRDNGQLLANFNARFNEVYPN